MRWTTTNTNTNAKRVQGIIWESAARTFASTNCSSKSNKIPYIYILNIVCLLTFKILTLILSRDWDWRTIKPRSGFFFYSYTTPVASICSADRVIRYICSIASSKKRLNVTPSSPTPLHPYLSPSPLRQPPHLCVAHRKCWSMIGIGLVYWQSWVLCGCSISWPNIESTESH